MARTTVLEASFVQFSRSFTNSILSSYEFDLDISRCVSAKYLRLIATRYRLINTVAGAAIVAIGIYGFWVNWEFFAILLCIEPNRRLHTAAASISSSVSSIPKPGASVGMRIPSLAIDMPGVLR